MARKALSAAEGSGDPLLQFSVNLAGYQVAIESGDPVMAAHTLTRLRATAQNVGEPYLRWLVVVAETFEATMAGRLLRRRDTGRGGARLRPADWRPGCVRDAHAGQFFVLRTFAGGHAELFPIGGTSGSRKSHGTSVQVGVRDHLCRSGSR